MKKLKLKNLLKLGILLFGISLFIVACQKDDDFKTIENSTSYNSSNFITKRIYSKEIEQNKIIKNKINEIKEKQNELKINAQNKTIYFSDYDFTINTDFAVYLENQDASYHSYTFNVLRDSTAFSLENLILSSNGNNDYDIYLSQYNLSQNDIALIQNNQSPDLSDKAILTKIIDEDFIDTIFSKETITIETLCPQTTFIAGSDCGCDGHHTLAQILNGTYCECFANGGVTLTADQTIFSWVDCDNVTSNGGGSAVGSTGGDGVLNPGDPIGYDPNYDATDPDIHEGNNTVVSAPAINSSQTNDPHPASLKKIAEIPMVSAELNRLKNNMGFSTQEDGKRFIYTGDNINSTSTYNDANFNEQSPTIKESNALSFPPLQANTLIGAHFHPDLDDSAPPKPIRKVPSGTDIAEHIVMVKKIAETNPTTPPQTNQVTNFVVSKGNSGKTYAIRTNDEQSIVDLDGDFDIDGDKRKEIADKLTEIILAIPVNNVSEQEAALVTYLAENYPSISIYVAVYNQAGGIKNWVKL